MAEIGKKPNYPYLDTYASFKVQKWLYCKNSLLWFAFCLQLLRFHKMQVFCVVYHCFVRDFAIQNGCKLFAWEYTVTGKTDDIHRNLLSPEQVYNLTKALGCPS